MLLGVGFIWLGFFGIVAVDGPLDPQVKPLLAEGSTTKLEYHCKERGWSAGFPKTPVLLKTTPSLA